MRTHLHRFVLIAVLVLPLQATALSIVTTHCLRHAGCGGPSTFHAMTSGGEIYEYAAATYNHVAVGIRASDSAPSSYQEAGATASFADTVMLLAPGLPIGAPVTMTWVFNVVGSISGDATENLWTAQANVIASAFAPGMSTDVRAAWSNTTGMTGSLGATPLSATLPNGLAYSWGFSLDLFGYVIQPSCRHAAGTCSWPGEASVVANFAHTLTFGNFRLFDASGNEITEFSLQSLDGFDYMAPVPVPGAAWLLGGALASLSLARRRSAALNRGRASSRFAAVESR